MIYFITNISKINRINEMFEDLIHEDFDEEDDEIEKLRSKSYEPSVNDILDKIRDVGIKSLTKQEKTILDNYAKQL